MKTNNSIQKLLLGARAAGLAAFAGASVACTAGGTSNASIEMRLTGSGGNSAISAMSQAEEDLVAVDESGTSFSVHEGRAYVRHIELDLPEGVGCDDLDGDLEAPVVCEPGEDKVEIEGPFVIDLISGEATPSLADLTLPDVAFTRVDIRFDDAESDDGLVSESDPLNEETIVAAGEFTYQAEPTPWSLVLGFNEDARFENEEGIELGSSDTLMLLLDVSVWFSDLPISECIADGDLEVDVDGLNIGDGDNSCSDVENALKDAIKESGQLDKSDDDDSSDDDDDDASDEESDESGTDSASDATDDSVG